MIISSAIFLTVCCVLLGGSVLRLRQALHTQQSLNADTRMEEALHLSEERHRLLSESAPIGIFQCDAQGLCLYTNPAWQEIAAVTLEQSLGRGWKKAVHPDDEDTVARAFERSLTGEGPPQAECRFARPSREIRWVRARWTCVHGEAGEISGYVGTCEDITERKRIREEQTRLLAILEATPDIVSFADAQGNIQYANQAMRDMMGVGRDTNIAAYRIADVHPAWAGELIAGQGLPAAVREGSWSGETAFLNAQKQEVPTSQVILAHKDETGNPLYFSTVARDISGSKRAEAQMQHLNTALSEAAEGVAFVDAEGRYTFANEAYALAVGRFPEEMHNLTWEDTVHPDDLARMRVDYAQMQAGGKTNSEVRGMRKDGSVFFKEVAMVRRRDAEGRFAGQFCFMKDITARKRAENDLQESEERFRLAIQSLQEGFVLQDEQGGILLCNESAEQILGLSAAQMMGRSSLNPEWRAVHEDGTDWPGDTHPAMISLREGIEHHNVIMGVHKPGGELTWVSINTSPLVRVGETRPYMVVVTFVDITRRRWFEEQMERQVALVQEYSTQLEFQQMELLQTNERLANLATTDGLTGLKNHRAFQEQLAKELERSARSAQPVSVILLDVDKFKQYNDTFGHPAGDEVLKTVSAVLQGQARSIDFVARYGGEEFVILLPDTDAGGAVALAERFRQALENAHWPHRAVTASFGVATQHVSFGESSLVADADVALYRSKARGRNCVTHYHDTEAQPVLSGAAG